MAQAVGVVWILWLGQNIPIEKGASMTPGGLQSKAVLMNGSWDTADEYVTGTVKCVTRVVAKTSVIGFRNGGRPGELQYGTDTGQTYVEPQAVVSNMPGITGGEGGKTALEWIIGEPLELLS